MAAFSLFNIIANLSLSIIVGFGIYNFSNSIIWAVVGSLLITGSASANPIFALLAYPIVEYFFNPNGLSIYSAVVVGINVAQIIYAAYMAKKITQTRYH